MEALFMPGATHFYRGKFADSRACHEKALSNFDDLERTKFWTAYTGHNASVTHRCYLSLDLWHLGFPEQALKLNQETRELARTIGHPLSMGHAADFMAYLHFYCRLGPEIQQAADEEFSIGTEQGFPLWQATGTLHKGAALLVQDHAEQAVPLFLKGLAAFQATGTQVRLPAYFGMLAEAYMNLSRFDEADRTLTEALAIVERNDGRNHEPELYRLQGELLLAQHPHQTADAEARFRKAIETAKQQQSKAWELRATVSLARLLQQLGRTDEARMTLAAIYDTFTEGATRPDLIAAKALL
jgi:tetratricopeptide (TPR) repeat protein